MRDLFLIALTIVGLSGLFVQYHQNHENPCRKEWDEWKESLSKLDSDPNKKARNFYNCIDPNILKRYSDILTPANFEPRMI